MSPRRLTALVLALAMSFTVGACGGDDEDGPSSSAVSPTTAAAPSTTGAVPTTVATTPPPDLGAVDVKLTAVASGLNGALALAVRSGDDTLYVARQGGVVSAIRAGSLDPAPVLDITGETKSGGEQGLLGLAFSPDGQLLYVNHTDRRGDTEIVEYAMDGGRANAASRRRVLSIDDPFPNHNGGNLVFGPDDMLWIGMGDGGSANDPQDNAQDLSSMLGKMLRIDPRQSGNQPYTVPPDNPFVGRTGAFPEIWAYGLRNPWRYSFDKATGDLWIGDVGQNSTEEVDFQGAGSRGGENYGWPGLEGISRNSFKPLPRGQTVAPVYTYDLKDGGNCAVAGGYVYRGSKIPAMVGAYLYADECVGEVMAFVYENGKATGNRSLGLKARALASFGQGLDGELYVLSLRGTVSRIDPA